MTNFNNKGSGSWSKISPSWFPYEDEVRGNCSVEKIPIPEFFKGFRSPSTLFWRRNSFLGHSTVGATALSAVIVLSQSRQDVLKPS